MNCKALSLTQVSAIISDLVRKPCCLWVPVVVTYLHLFLASTVSVTSAFALYPQALWSMSKPSLAEHWQGRCGEKSDVCFCCLRSLRFLSSNLFNTWNTQSVPSPILSHIPSETSLSLSLSLPSPLCILLASPLNSLPLSPSILTFATLSHPPSSFDIYFIVFSKPFGPFNKMFLFFLALLVMLDKYYLYIYSYICICPLFLWDLCSFLFPANIAPPVSSYFSSLLSLSFCSFTGNNLLPLYPYRP